MKELHVTSCYCTGQYMSKKRAASCISNPFHALFPALSVTVNPSCLGHPSHISRGDDVGQEETCLFTCWNL